MRHLRDWPLRAFRRNVDRVVWVTALFRQSLDMLGPSHKFE